MSGDAAATTLGELLAHEAQVAELKARLIARVDQAGVADAAGATSTATWLAATHRLTRAQAHRETRLAVALGARHQVRDALAGGAIHVDQAAVVIRAVSELPDDLDPAVVEQAEAHLVVEAQRFDAKSLVQLGRRVLEVVSPETADALEARLLESRRTRRRRRHHPRAMGRPTRPHPPARPRPARDRRDAAQGAARDRRAQAPGR